jgi:hypothetical protein
MDKPPLELVDKIPTAEDIKNYLAKYHYSFAEDSHDFDMNNERERVRERKERLQESVKKVVEKRKKANKEQFENEGLDPNKQG